MDRNGVKMAYCSSELSRGVSLSLSLFLSIYPSLSHPISDELLKFACGSSWPKLHEKLCQLLGDFLDLTVGNSSVSAMLCTRTLSTDAALLSSSSDCLLGPAVKGSARGGFNPQSLIRRLKWERQNKLSHQQAPHDTSFTEVQSPGDPRPSKERSCSKSF